MARRAFAQLHVVYLLHLFLDQHTLLSHLLPDHHPFGYYNKLYIELILKSIQNFQLAQNAMTHIVLGKPKFTHVPYLLMELHQLPICFWVEFKMLIYHL